MPSQRKLANRIQAMGGGLLSAVPPRAAVALSGRRALRIDGQELDPGLQLLLRAMALQGTPELIRKGATSVERERARISQQATSSVMRPTPVAGVRELLVDGAHGQIRARHYRPDAGEKAPLLVYVHGGGWVVGDLDTHDEYCRLTCRNAGVHVLSVDYALAPEHPFPEGLEDVIAATRWAFEHAAELGADPERIAIGGDSAGGNLATVATQQLHAAGGPVPVLQLLIYPATDFVEERPSLRLFGQGLFLTDESRDWCKPKYVGDHDVSDPRLSPLRGELEGLPPAIVITAAFDPLRDEGEAYVEALRDADVDVVALRVPGMIHGFINLTPANRAARDAVIMIAGMIRLGLAVAA
jgi:acetyl esterase/lipase